MRTVMVMMMMVEQAKENIKAVKNNEKKSTRLI